MIDVGASAKRHHGREGLVPPRWDQRIDSSSLGSVAVPVLDTLPASLTRPIMVRSIADIWDARQSRS
jgi:hypothetical protein